MIWKNRTIGKRHFRPPAPLYLPELQDPPDRGHLLHYRQRGGFRCPDGILQRLIDTCILPGLKSGMESVKQPFMQTILSMLTIYAFGVAAAFTYTHLMAIVTQER